MSPDAQKKKSSDFRYDTGEARAPWPAVGESYQAQDVAEVVRFLMKPKDGQEEEYGRLMVEATEKIRQLSDVSLPATKLTLGDKVKEAEDLARGYFGVKHACLLSNWTAGMEIAYKLSGLRPGDEVIIASITFISTMLYPLSIGAKVVFADVDPATINIDPADVERKITDKTKAIMVVHIGGTPVDMDPIMEIAKKHDLYVIEDAAHALGAKYKGRWVGAIGHFGGYSLHEVKNINSFGEGGLLLTDLDLGAQFPLARFCGLDFSSRVKDWLYDISPLYDRHGGVHAPGNHSVTEIQALGFLLQMKRLDDIIQRRRAAAERLSRRLAEEPGILAPREDTDETCSTHHLYLLRIDPEQVGGDIQRMKAKLKARGVTEIQHFAPLYRFKIIEDMGYDQAAIAASCPRTEQCFNHCYTHLPLYGLTPEQLDYMAEAVIESVREMKAGR